MSRDEIRERLALWMEDMLSPEEMAEVEARLAESETYRREYEKMQQIDRLLESAPLVGPSPGFTQRFETRLARRRQRRQTRLKVVLATLLMLLGLGLGGVIIAGSSLALLDLWSNVSQLGQWVSLALGVLDRIRVIVNTGLLIGRSLLSILGQPIFIGYLLLTAGLISLWMQLMRRLAWSQRTVRF